MPRSFLDRSSRSGLSDVSNKPVATLVKPVAEPAPQPAVAEPNYDEIDDEIEEEIGEAAATAQPVAEANCDEIEKEIEADAPSDEAFEFPPRKHVDDDAATDAASAPSDVATTSKPPRVSWLADRIPQPDRAPPPPVYALAASAFYMVLVLQYPVLAWAALAGAAAVAAGGVASKAASLEKVQSFAPPALSAEAAAQMAGALNAAVAHGWQLAIWSDPTESMAACSVLLASFVALSLVSLSFLCSAAVFAYLLLPFVHHEEKKKILIALLAMHTLAVSKSAEVLQTNPKRARGIVAAASVVGLYWLSISLNMLYVCATVTSAAGCAAADAHWHPERKVFYSQLVRLGARFARDSAKSAFVDAMANMKKTK